MSKTRLLTVLLLAGLGIVLAGCKGKKPLPKSPAPAKDSGETAVKKAPDFALTDHNGKQVKLADYSGQIVVLEWLNYDCPFVKPHYEAGTFANLAGKYADNGVVLPTVNSTEYATGRTNKAWAQKYNLARPILDDRAGKVGRLFGATNTPHMYIIDTAGKIVYEGAIDNAPLGKVEGEYVNYVDKALAELAAGKSVSVARTKAYGCTVKYAN